MTQYTRGVRAGTVKDLADVSDSYRTTDGFPHQPPDLDRRESTDFLVWRDAHQILLDRASSTNQRNPKQSMTRGLIRSTATPVGERSALEAPLDCSEKAGLLAWTRLSFNALLYAT
jgi:hypothetical protein